MNNTSKSPVVIIACNRPQGVKEVLKSVIKWKPPRIYAVIDRPSSDITNQTFNRVVDLFKDIDSNISVVLDLADTNLGLRKRIVTGLNNVFEHEDRAIILEDDCIPDQSFFPFAEELLEKYAHDERVLSIAGFTGLKGVADTSYVFSRYIESWGWATWKRAWSKYDEEMVDWPKLKGTSWLKSVTLSKWEELYWKYVFELTYQGKINSWAYRWMYSSFIQQGLTIAPKHNLVNNIGFGKDATHTKVSISLPPVVPMQFPLIHPTKVEVNETHDRLYNRKLLSNPIGVLGLLKAHLLMSIGFKS